MRIAIASDHRGFKLKSILAEYLRDRGYTIIDFGTYSSDSCDYPDYVYPASVAVKNKQADRAIIVCYSGIGSCIVANRLKGIRAALAVDIKRAALSRKHNNSNVLVLGAGFLKREYAKKLVTRWLAIPFEGGRHLRRLKKIERIEEKV